MPYDAHNNLAYSTVAVPPSPPLSGTSLTLAAGQGALMPAVPFNATVWAAGVMPLTINAEIVRVTAVVGDVLTITRNQESTSARSIQVGDQFANTATVKVFTDLETGKQDVNAKLTSIIALTFASLAFVKMTAANTFALDTNVYLTANQTVTLSGDVSGSGATAITTAIGAGKVTLAMQANLAANSLIGNNTGSPATPLALTISQVKTLLAITPADLSGLGTGVATALAVNVGSAGAFVVFNGALGTPSSGTVTNLSGTASININGTVGATTPNSVASTTLTASGAVTFTGTTDSSSISTGIAVISGGVGIAKKLFVGTDLNVAGNNTVLGQLTAGTSDVGGQGTFFVKGTTKGCRFYTTSTGAVIEAVDNTGITSYQPLALGGSTVTIQQSGTTVAVFSSTGVAITGAVSATKAITEKQAAGDTYINSGIILIRNGNNNQWNAVIDGSSNFAMGYAANPAVPGDFVTYLTLSNVGALAVTSFSTTGKYTTYNNVATAGWGVPAIYGTNNRAVGVTGSQASLYTYTVGGADGSFLISANVLVTTATLHNFTVTCTYTDESNTARTLTLTFSQTSGTLLTAITNVTGAGAYEGVQLHIRAKAGTTITFATTGTFTTVTYNAEAVLAQIG